MKDRSKWTYHILTGELFSVFLISWLVGHKPGLPIILVLLLFPGFNREIYRSILTTENHHFTFLTPPTKNFFEIFHVELQSSKFIKVSRSRASLCDFVVLHTGVVDGVVGGAWHTLICKFWKKDLEKNFLLDRDLLNWVKPFAEIDFDIFLVKWRHFKYRMLRQWFIIYDSLYMTHELCMMMFRNLPLNGLQKRQNKSVRNWPMLPAGWFS